MALDLCLPYGCVAILSESFRSLRTVDLFLYFSGHRYVTLKVFVTSHRQALNEEKVYQHLSCIKTDNACADGIRSLLDSFKLPGESGNHQCLIHEPLGLTLRDIRELSDGEKVSDDLLKPFIRYLLGALDFLHTEAKVVHTGSSPIIEYPSHFADSSRHSRRQRHVGHRRRYHFQDFRAGRSR